jgi:hypothetical protein
MHDNIAETLIASNALKVSVFAFFCRHLRIFPFMKRIHDSCIYCLVILMAMTFACMGCNRDKCKHVICVNGECIDGTCNCSTGYFGTDCNTVVNAGFAGGWAGTEECIAGSDEYQVSMAAEGSSLTNLTMVGFWGIEDDTVIAVVGDNGLDMTIARQRLRNVDVEGEGLANDRQDEVNLTFRVYNLGQSQPFDQCTATLLKD